MENDTPPKIEKKDEGPSEDAESHYEQHREMARPTFAPNPSERLAAARADGDGGAPFPKEVKMNESGDLNKRERELAGQVKVLEARVEDRKKELDRLPDNAPDRKELTDKWLRDQRDLKIAKKDLNETRKEILQTDPKVEKLRQEHLQGAPDAANRLDASQKETAQATDNPAPQKEESKPEAKPEKPEAREQELIDKLKQAQADERTAERALNAAQLERVRLQVQLDALREAKPNGK